MKWEDLEPGDVLEYTKEYEELVVPIVNFNKWWDNRKYFTVKNIKPQKDGTTINISFVETPADEFPMLISNGADRDFINFYNGPAFKIVSLKEN